MGNLERRLVALETAEREAAVSKIRSVLTGVSDEEFTRLLLAYEANDLKAMEEWGRSWGLTNQDYEAAISDHHILSEDEIKARFDELHAPALRRGPRIMQTLARLRAEEVHEGSTTENDQ
jgi:hypothetical protein